MSDKKKDRPMKVLWNSNALWSPSGYGQQSAEIVPKIKEAGHDIACIDYFGLEGGIVTIDDIIHYPRMAHIYGSDAMVHHGKDFGADITISFQDAWVLHPEDLQRIKNWIPLVPIDREPAPQPVIDKLKLAYRIITYSQFGQDELKKNGLHSTYIQHTVDTDIFVPLKEGTTKAMLKKSLGLPEDCFLVGMVGANKDNPPRKSFQEVMDAFAQFLKKHPNSYLYIHTDPDGPGGFPIKYYAKFLGIQSKVLYPDLYAITYKLKKTDMVRIYQTMDVLMMPSISEGFGLTAIEAQACGTPVIVNNYSSMPEMVKNHITGEICEVHSKRFDGLLSYVAIPSTKSIYDCLNRIKDSDREATSRACRSFMLEKYSTRKIFDEKWAPFLEKVKKEVVEKTS